jgi:hypothetical protein
MPSASYRLPDEPTRSPLSHLAVNPVWPLLAIMFGGAWLSWPWFLVNSLALGSPTKRKEVALVFVAFLGSAGILIGGATLAAAAGWEHPKLFRFLGLIILLWKLGVSYWLQVLQSRPLALFQHFGGTLRNPMFLLVAGFLLGRRLPFDALPEWVQVVIQ